MVEESRLHYSGVFLWALTRSIKSRDVGWAGVKMILYWSRNEPGWSEPWVPRVYSNKRPSLLVHVDALRINCNTLSHVPIISYWSIKLHDLAILKLCTIVTEIMASLQKLVISITYYLILPGFDWNQASNWGFLKGGGVVCGSAY